MTALSLAILLALPSEAEGPRVLDIESSAPLLTVKIMVRAGAAQDPPGQEGLSALTGRMLIEGAFGDPAAPVTKERLAEMTRRWGGGALPTASIAKETTVFSLTVPREALAEYAETVLGPLFSRPLFLEAELSRLKAEGLEGLRSLRLEQMESSGLQAVEDWLHEGTAYGYPDSGTERGLRAVDSAAVRRFYRAWYRSSNIVIAVSSKDPVVADALRKALGVGAGWGGAQPRSSVPAPLPASAPEAVVVANPGAQSTGLHAAFPLQVTRGHPDFWPLYVSNVWFGAHRDMFSHLYHVLREERGYNYGDYSYIENFTGRPFNLFQPPNAPRRLQLFSIWVRPVAHEHAAHVARAVDWELSEFARGKLSEEQCALAKRKARVLFLSLTESTDNLVAGLLDDDFLGLAPGWLESYLAGVDATTCAAMNAALRRHLAGRALRWLAVTDAARAEELAGELSDPGPHGGKGPADYQIDVAVKDGRAVYEIPEDRLETLRLDAVWAHHSLGLERGRVRIVPVDRLFARPGLSD